MRALSKAFMARTKTTTCQGAHAHTHTPDTHTTTYTYINWDAHGVHLFIPRMRANIFIQVESESSQKQALKASFAAARQAAAVGEGSGGRQTYSWLYMPATFALLQLQLHPHLHLYPHAKLQIWYVNFALVGKIIQITWHEALTPLPSPKTTGLLPPLAAKPNSVVCWNQCRRKWHLLLDTAECNLGRFAAAHQQIGESLPVRASSQVKYMQSVFASVVINQVEFV